MTNIVGGHDLDTQQGRADFRAGGGWVEGNAQGGYDYQAPSGDTGHGGGGQHPSQGATFDTPGGVSSGPAQGPVLPLLNGHPVSPSNGFTGQQTPYIMYRGDPLYSQYFGPGTPGYQATSRTYNATAGPLPQGQATYEGTYGSLQAPKPATSSSDSGAGSSYSDTSLGGDTTSVPAPSGYNYTPETSDQSIARQTWMSGLQQPSDSGYGYGPYATADQPDVKPQGTYTDNGRTIEKSVDQYGNPYYRDVGAASAAPAVSTPAAPAAAPAQNTTSAGTTSGTNTTTGTNTNTTTGTNTTNTTNQQTVAIALPDGSGVVQIPADQADAVRADLAKAAQALAASQQFSQGLQQQQFDLTKMVDQANMAYQQALLQYNNAQLAQTAAYQAMQIELQKQAQELTRQGQAQQFTLASQQAADARANQANQLSMQREQLNLQRQQLRSGRRVSVRYA